MKRAELMLLAAAGLVVGPLRALAQPAPIRMGTLLAQSVCEGLYGLDAGIFKQAGLDVDVSLPSSSGGAQTAAVVSGSLDVGMTNIGSAAAAHARGISLYLFAPCALFNATDPWATAVCVAKDGPIHTAADLSGKTVCVSTVKDMVQAATMRWIDDNGGNSKAVTFVEVPIVEMERALLAKRIDAAVLQEPFLSPAKGTTRSLADPYAAIAKELLITGWIANPAWYDRNRALARRLEDAIRTIATWANANPQPAATILEKYTKIPHDVILSMNRYPYGEVIEPSLIQPIIDTTAHYGFLPHSFAASELLPPKA